MLETVREYGLEQLAASGETETYRMRHAEYMVRLSEEAEPHLWSLTRRAWLTRLAHDLENIRAALAWSETAPGRIELGLRLAGNLYWFWRLGIHWREIRVWLESVLARTDASELTAPRAKALWCLGMHSYFLGDLVTARSRFEESVEIWRRLGEKPGLARALSALGLVRRIQGDYTARSLQEEAVAICRELGDRPATARALFMLGSAPGTPDDHVRAREALSESAALNRGLGDPWALAPVLLMLGIGAYQRGDYAEARPHFDEALGVFREVNDRWHLARTLQGLGQLERAEGNDLSAWTQFREALTLYQELAVPAGIANCLAGCAGDARSRPERRVHLLAAADALWEALGVHLDPVDRAEVDREVGAARMMLGEAAFATAWAEGRAMTPEQAIAYAMEGSGSA
jgi:tetratricopeptide (TPR) repeat protein